MDSNDVYDFDTGADKNKKESVVNLVGSRSGTSIAAYLSLGLGFVGLTWTSLGASSMQAILLLACAITCGYIYQVRLGTERGSYVVKAATITLYSLLLAFGLSRALPFPCILLCALTVPTGKLVVSFVEENHKDKGKIFMAKYYCVRLHALFGTALAAGLVAARMLTRKHVPSLMFS
ncbi:hypothetical protein RCOM_0822650 [Ricinus communis]|uniref:Uncharacterized protein n=1 Tax=Ricinus communis TaxID=3988 RepID=B9SIL4_RICCO|nr:hypothetical protein RCOM_0822650 [Ricinus communis]